MESTTNYSMFKDFSSNREIDPKHVKQLVREIEKRNLLSVNPILVDKDFHIIDGQHRLEAAKALKIPIYYIIGDVRRDDISKINSCQKNWNQMDYINYYTIEGRPAYVKISNLINHYPQFQTSALIALSNPELRRCSEDIRRGDLDSINADFAREVCDIIIKLNEKYLYGFVFDSRFPIALAKAMNTEGFNLDNLLKKIDDSPRSFVACHTVREYLTMIEDVYNFQLSKNKIRLT
jgi:hypothetical protein